MNSPKKKLFLLDAFALIFRGYYAFIKNPRITSKGMDVSAIMGFTNSLLDVLKKEKPSHIAVVFDVGKATVRTNYYQEYKANRNETPEAIKLAVPYIHKILKALKIPSISAQGYEADDVIGTLAKKAEKEGFMTYMVTPDKDFAQLVSENIKMYRPAARGEGPQIWGIEEVKEKFGINEPIQVIDFLGMMGDSVDNIPGLPGVGKKTAEKFIQKYGSMENLLANTHELKGKLKEKIEANKELGILSKKLATILLDAPVELNEQELLLGKPDMDAITEIFNELEFRRMLDNVRKTYSIESPANSNLDIVSEKQSNPSSIQAATIQASLFDEPLDLNPTIEREGQKETNSPNTKTHFQYIDSPKGLQLLVQTLMQQEKVAISLHSQTSNPMQTGLLGLAVSYKKNSGYYIPLYQKKSNLDALKPFLEQEKNTKIGHDLKFIYKCLHQHKIQLKGTFFDTSIAHYLINPDMQHELDSLSQVYLQEALSPLTFFTGKKGKNQVTFESLEKNLQTQFLVEKAVGILALETVFLPLLKENQVDHLFHQTEMPLMLVLAKMELAGINLNKEALSKYRLELNAKIKDLEEHIYANAEEEFNLNSPKQLGLILFEKMKLSEKPKKTKTGQYATSEEVLSKLKDKNPIIKYILTYRQLQKLRSTYVDALPEEINPNTQRIHTTFGQTVAATGRLSSNKPNLQNIPIRTPEGQKVREAFIPKKEGYVLLAADYSQIELRLIAEMSQDPVMTKAFLDGADIHATTAANIFNVPLNEITREQRSQAKTVNFGIIYGVSAFGLSEQTGLSRTEAKELIEAYYQTYPALKKYMGKQVDFAREHSYVETLMGRRRYLKDINSSNSLVRSHAERNAVNAPIQGTAADIIKIAMIQIDKILENYETEMILQVHDELVFDVPSHELKEVKPLIQSTMENAIKTTIPLVVECGVGQNWLEAH